jgi:hypothetical protein
MATFNKVDQYSEDMAKGVHDLNGDTLKVLLTNTAPVAATTKVKGDLTEISAGNGYSAGGVDVQNATSRSGAVTSVTGVDVVFTASGGTIGPTRYAVLYNDSVASPVKPVIGWWDYASSITLADGESLTVDFGSAILTVG